MGPSATKPGLPLLMHMSVHGMPSRHPNSPSIQQTECAADQLQKHDVHTEWSAMGSLLDDAGHRYTPHLRKPWTVLPASGPTMLSTGSVSSMSSKWRCHSKQLLLVSQIAFKVLLMCSPPTDDHLYVSIYTCVCIHVCKMCIYMASSVVHCATCLLLTSLLFLHLLIYQGRRCWEVF